MISEEGVERRKRILSDIVKLRGSLPALLDELRNYPWDIDEPLVSVTPTDIVRVLKLYLGNEISADLISMWADGLEMRDDVQFDDRLSEFFLEASTPEIFEPISRAFAERWIDLLG